MIADTSAGIIRQVLAGYPGGLTEYPGVQPWPGGPRVPNRCLGNSVEIAAEHPDLHVVVGLLCVEHSWVVDRGGIAYEVTLPGPFLGGPYLGVPLALAARGSTRATAASEQTERP